MFKAAYAALINILNQCRNKLNHQMSGDESLHYPYLHT